MSRSWLRRYGPALLLALVVFALAPAIGEARDALFALFGERAVGFAAAALAAVGLAVAGWGLWRIRSHRGWRYGGIALAALLVALSVVFDADGGARVAVVEKVHIVEYGLLAVLLYRGRRHAGDASMVLLPLAWTATAGTLDEGIQWLAPQRVGEIRDVALNAWAGLCGVVFALAAMPPAGFRLRLGDDGRRLLARSAAVLVLALAVFWSVAHAGHWIEDPEVGRFRSWHTAAELEELAARRAREWAAHPPRELPVWGIQDLYMTEAAAHVSHRNAAWDAGHARAAWHANRILERWYAPFLDTRSIASGEPHRYSPAARAEVERRGAPPRPGRYTSPVLANRVRTAPPPAAVLGVAGVVAVMLWLAGGGTMARRSAGTKASEP